MKMTGSTRLVDGVTIVDLGGRIVLGEGSDGLRDLVHSLIKEGNKKILLNLRDVDYVDSSGLGELVNALTSMRGKGGELKLLNLTKRVQSLLRITKLYTVFDITADEATSVRSFSPRIGPSIPAARVNYEIVVPSNRREIIGSPMQSRLAHIPVSELFSQRLRRA
jgi:anti-sigma B factor antagonist